jgi:hypothetical protein
LRSTGEIDLPWAERLTLLRELHRAIKREADRRGLSQREMSREFVEGKSADTTAKLVVDAVRQLVIPTKTLLELEDAQRRIAELEAKLASS